MQEQLRRCSVAQVVHDEAPPARSLAVVHLSVSQTHSDLDRVAMGYYFNQIGLVHRVLVERLAKKVAKAIAIGMFDPDRSEEDGPP